MRQFAPARWDNYNGRENKGEESCTEKSIEVFQIIDSNLYYDVAYLHSITIIINELHTFILMKCHVLCT